MLTAAATGETEAQQPGQELGLRMISDDADSAIVSILTLAHLRCGLLQVDLPNPVVLLRFSHVPVSFAHSLLQRDFWTSSHRPRPNLAARP
jgi:hypothetical protein